MMDKQVVGVVVREPPGAYVVHKLGTGDEPANSSHEKTLNETDMIRTRP